MGKVKNIDRTERILGEIPADLRPLCEEVMTLVADSESAKILARYRLGQLVDIAYDVKKYGVAVPAQIARLFRVSEETLRRARTIARGWSRNELVAALRDDPMLRLGHVTVLAEVRDRSAWLKRVRLQAMSEGDLRRAFVGSSKPTIGNGRVVSPVVMVNQVLSLAKQLESMKPSEVRLSYEQLDELSKSLADAAQKLAQLNRKYASVVTMKRAG